MANIRKSARGLYGISQSSDLIRFIDCGDSQPKSQTIIGHYLCAQVSSFSHLGQKYYFTKTSGKICEIIYEDRGYMFFRDVYNTEWEIIYDEGEVIIE